ncbi:hypothetical protein CSV86_002700 [Pseudomonas putida CSV86]|uniref:Uncharacterized protein n=1 Tax=Pseudomonas bharatica CSV86 TaxID=1005395 RepID=L1M3Y3_9PSED|nr:hypothetical protein [Pseudomonas bharatica]NNJ14242.1 hypothetical protein [Pseudomonas bharatica CSV86]
MASITRYLNYHLKACASREPEGMAEDGQPPFTKDEEKQLLAKTRHRLAAPQRIKVDLKDL